MRRRPAHDAFGWTLFDERTPRPAVVALALPLGPLHAAFLADKDWLGLFHAVLLIVSSSAVAVTVEVMVPPVVVVRDYNACMASTGIRDPRSGPSASDRFETLIASGVIRPPVEAGDPTEGWPDVRLTAGSAAELVDADRGEA